LAVLAHLAGVAIGVGRTLRRRDAAAAFADLAGFAVLVAYTFRTTLVVSALLIARAIGGRGAVSRNLFADAGITLQRGIAALLVGRTFLAEAVDAIKAPFLLTFVTFATVIIGFAVRVVGLAAGLRQ
jgi:hypothetical protein